MKSCFPYTFSVVLALLGMADFSNGAETNPRNILRKRTARWQHELNRPAESATAGAESNPTGHPIGGGKGYGDLIKKGTYTVKTFQQLESALKRAKEGEVVFLPEGTDIDLSGKPTLVIPGGVTVASTRGHGDFKGARLFSRNINTPGMFASGGPHGRITGLRLEGPAKGTARVPLHSRGVSIEHFGFEIDNCELWGFSHSAVRGHKGAVRIYLHHNYIHHTIRSGLGYGLSLSESTALIEANRFDYGRHFLAATGAPGEGYEARYNICGPKATSHQFDMHGGRDRGDGTNIAGDWMNIHHNTFLARKVAVKIRGVPSQNARIHRNRFVYGSEKGNAASSGRTRVEANVLGRPPKPKSERPKK